MVAIDYICNEGERWDTVAFKCYGDPSLMNTIIESILTTGAGSITYDFGGRIKNLN